MSSDHDKARDASGRLSVAEATELAGEILANALGRQRKDQNLQKAFSEVDQLKDRLQQENIYLKEEAKLEHKHSEIAGKTSSCRL